MNKMSEYDFESAKCKNGDIKVNARELLSLFRIMQPFCPDDCNYIDYFFNKYIVLGEKRIEEQKWYNLMKEIDEGKFDELGADAIAGYRKEVFSFYSDAKKERELLSEELQKNAENVDNW